MKMILATKVGMTNLFDANGKRYAATILHAEPNKVLGTKTLDKDGYTATKVGYFDVKEKNLNKAKLGEFKHANCNAKRYVREFRNVTGFNIGDEIKCDVFNKGEYVDVQAYSKGHGFTGSIKRHNFSVGPLGHGAGYPHRYVGSICGGRGGSQAQRVMKGTELPGHYGNELTTIANQFILDIDKDNNLIIVQGAIPGAKKSLVCVKLAKKKPTQKHDVHLVNIKLQAKEHKQEPVLETPVEQNEQPSSEIQAAEISGSKE